MLELLEKKINQIYWSMVLHMFCTTLNCNKTATSKNNNFQFNKYHKTRNILTRSVICLSLQRVVVDQTKPIIRGFDTRTCTFKTQFVGQLSDLAKIYILIAKYVDIVTIAEFCFVFTLI